MDIYAQNILDRYKNPLHKDKNIKVTCKNQCTNHTCGDKIMVKLETQNSQIEDYSFSGAGCALSMAAADILGDLIIKKTLDEIKELTESDMIEALGIEVSERRSKCALLALGALKEEIEKIS